MPIASEGPVPMRAPLLALFDAALSRVAADRCVPPHLPTLPRGKTVVVGAGKAAAAMALAVERHWRGSLGGVVVTRYGHGVPCARIAVREAAHPVPDAAGELAAREIMAAVADLTQEDLVICLISGGGSALMPALPPTIALHDEQALAHALLRSGAPIGDINVVRKHVSLVKGGRLALAARPAQVLTLIVSDVPGDDPAQVASGPTVADSSTREHAQAILAAHEVPIPPAIADWLARVDSETPPADALTHARHVVVANAGMALDAAADAARAMGFAAEVLGDAIEGEARLLGTAHAALARSATGPRVLLSGGETTVTVRGTGRGGRNLEYLLSLAIALQGAPGVSALAADTDGIDGTEEAAGATIDETTLARAALAGIDPTAMLADNDAYSFFSALGDLVGTGPTRTNVNDFRAVLIEAARAPTGAQAQ